MYSSQGKRQEAIAEYREAIRLDPDYGAAHNNLAVDLLAEDGTFAEAAAEFREAIRLGIWQSCTSLALCLRESECREAIALYQEAIRLAPKEANPRADLASLLCIAADPACRDYGQALQLAKSAVALQPDMVGCQYALGYAEFRNGNWAAALEALQQTMQFSNNVDDTDRLFLAMTHWPLGDQRQAREWYAKAVSWRRAHEPDNAQLGVVWTEAAELLGETLPTAEPTNHKESPESDGGSNAK